MENMCIDYYLARDYLIRHEPVIRFYGWEPFCLSLGKHQDSNDVDIDVLRTSEYDLVRRPTGGSAIFHSEELTYCFAVPGKSLNHTLLYQLFHTHLAEALRILGYPVTLETHNTRYRLNKGGNSFACFNRAAISELQYEGRKVVGSAQKIFPDSLLQHGSILSGTSHLEILNFLKIDQTAKKRYQSMLLERSISLSEIQPGKPNFHEITDHIAEGFKKHYDLRIFFRPISCKEYNEAEKYKDIFKIRFGKNRDTSTE